MSKKLLCLDFCLIVLYTVYYLTRNLLNISYSVQLVVGVLAMVYATVRFVYFLMHI